ncbi:MAG TPA: DUF1080 domain-containing protein [Acidobacteriota bacterium]|nr:DUF1080 domain-containing protein [Acidobacteriota bacterium]
MYVRRILSGLVLIGLTAGWALSEGQPPNTLTDKEIKAGWKLLFDGKTTTGWRGAKLDKFPEFGWTVENGELIVLESGGGESRHGGDIVTIEQYDNFELSVEFKLTPGANSGIKYMVFNVDPNRPGSALGLEYQILDDSRHPDATRGIAGNRTLGSLYDLIPASPDKVVKPTGEWNHARILVDGKHVEHWLNGKKIVEYERGSEAFRAQKAQSKFRDIKDFGEHPRGHILLQDHGNRVSFRNIKIRPITHH